VSPKGWCRRDLTAPGPVGDESPGGGSTRERSLPARRRVGVAWRCAFLWPCRILTCIRQSGSCLSVSCSVLMPQLWASASIAFVARLTARESPAACLLPTQYPWPSQRCPFAATLRPPTIPCTWPRLRAPHLDKQFDRQTQRARRDHLTRLRTRFCSTEGACSNPRALPGVPKRRTVRTQEPAYGNVGLSKAVHVLSSALRSPGSSASWQ
jgi:hypothetical protein